MTDTIVTELEIKNQRGLHARAAANFVKAIDGLDVDVEVERLGQTVDGNSIMGLMMLAASIGTKIKNFWMKLNNPFMKENPEES